MIGQHPRIRSRLYRSTAGSGRSRAATAPAPCSLLRRTPPRPPPARRAYGSPRVTAELREKGRRVNEKRVARIMRTFSITGI
ncbi:IS3 family transposase, partial [Streptomyces kaempferi]